MQRRQTRAGSRAGKGTRALMAGAAAALLLASTGTPRGHAATPATHVNVRTFQFQPDTLTVPAGTRVVWHNQDETRHAVTAGTPERPEEWGDRELAGRGSSAEVVFARPGVFAYHCGHHPSMTGVVRVTRTGQEP